MYFFLYVGKFNAKLFLEFAIHIDEEYQLVCFIVLPLFCLVLVSGLLSVRQLLVFDLPGKISRVRTKLVLFRWRDRRVQGASSL